MIMLIALLVGCLVGAVLWAVAMTRAFDYSLDYARRRADELDVTDSKGSAYSDMSTVMVLAMDRGGRRYLDTERKPSPRLDRRRS